MYRETQSQSANPCYTGKDDADLVRIYLIVQGPRAMLFSVIPFVEEWELLSQWWTMASNEEEENKA